MSTFVPIKKKKIDIDATPIVDGQLLVATDTSMLSLAVDVNSMTRKILDTDSIVEAVKNEIEFDGIQVYTHEKTGTIHNFIGSGPNGRAKITAAFAPGDTFAVNGVACAAYTGADPTGELPVGRWVTFVYDGTQINFKGGSGLDVTVVLSTTRPENPKEFTIWVNTSTGTQIVILDVDPGASAYPAGTVWIRTGVNYNTYMPMAHKGQITLIPGAVTPGAIRVISAPISAYESNGTSWMVRQMQAFTNGAWKVTDLVLFDKATGDRNLGITGGYGANIGSGSGFNVTADVAPPAGSPLRLSISYGGYSHYGAYLFSGVKFDVTAYSRLRIQGSASGGGDGGQGGFKVGLSSLQVSNDPNIAYVSGVPPTFDLTLNISSVTGMAYFEASMVCYGYGSRNVHIDKIWLEV